MSSTFYDDHEPSQNENLSVVVFVGSTLSQQQNRTVHVSFGMYQGGARDYGYDDRQRKSGRALLLWAVIEAAGENSQLKGTLYSKQKKEKARQTTHKTTVGSGALCFSTTYVLSARCIDRSKDNIRFRRHAGRTSPTQRRAP